MIDPRARWHLQAVMLFARPGSPLSLLPALLLSLGLSACDEGEDDDLVDGMTTTTYGGDEDEADEDEPGEPEPEPEEEVVDNSCDQLNAQRECTGEAGVQFCGPMNYGEEPTWGPCLTEWECTLGESEPCFSGEEAEEFGNPSSVCRLYGGVPMWDWDACNTPLALSFDGGPIEMVASPASFDISGAGECLSTDWPAAKNPWLAIDLDRSGSIDGGHELFGSGSILTSGHHARNGFLALSEYDSNHDGAITAADARFDDILVWRDGDSDKRSAGSELSTLAEEGVTRISLGYEVGQECDARGNCGRERAAFEFTAGSQVRAGEVIDIYMPCW